MLSILTRELLDDLTILESLEGRANSALIEARENHKYAKTKVTDLKRRILMACGWTWNGGSYPTWVHTSGDAFNGLEEAWWRQFGGGC